MAAFLAVLAALPAFIQALPYMFQFMLRVMTLVEKFLLWAEKKEFNQWLNDVEVVIDKLENSKTVEQKRDAARSMVDLIRKLQ